MTRNEQERVIVWRRLIKEDKKLSFLDKMSDIELLEILNSAVLPNSLSLSNMKYSVFFNLIYKKKETLSFLSKIKDLFEILSPLEKDMLKFGIFKGFDSYNSRYQMGRFLKHSTDIEKGELAFPKQISLKSFEGFFDFVYKIINKGEKNGRFPRI